MRYLITGIAGFIGFHFASRAIKDGHCVVGIDNFNNYYDVNLKFNRLRELGIDASEVNKRVFNNNNISIIKGNIEDESTWNLIDTYNIDVVVHLAAQAGVRYSLTNSESYISSNIVGFHKVLEFCVKKSIIRFIYASSSSVYGSILNKPFSEDIPCIYPESFYAATKIANEVMAYSYFKTKGIPSIGLRFFTVFGPWGRPDMAPMLFAKAAITNEAISVYNMGLQKRDFTFIDDIIEGIIRCSRIEFNDAITLNIGKGEPENLMDFIKLIEKYFHITLKKDFHAAQIGDVSETFADTKKLISLTGYKPNVSLKDGIRRFCDWYSSYYVDTLK
jgi:UDP-glucuronate 4-epimerase